MRTRGFWCGVALASILWIAPMPLVADQRTWKAATTGDWFEASNWVEEIIPAAGDDVVITNRGSSVLLTNSTDALNSFLLKGAVGAQNTLVCSQWDSILSAGGVTIDSLGTVTLPPAFTNGAPSNNVHILCADLLVASGGRINADSRGYARGEWYGNGPGGGTNFGTSDHYDCGGAGHGGYGGRWQKSPLYGHPYGSETNPTAPGSGGANLASGRDGGGAIRIHAINTVTVNGTISANGGSAGAYGSAGSGGSIWITCLTFSGTNGAISANGGNADVVNTGGGGSGGRIAVLYDSAAQAIAPTSSVRLSATGGTGTRIFGYGSTGTGNPDGYGDMGTISLPDPLLFSPTFVHSGRLIVPSFNSWGPPHLVVTNAAVQFPAGLALNVTNDILIVGASARLTLVQSTLRCGGDLKLDAGDLDFDADSATGLSLFVAGDLILTNSGAQLHVRGGITNAQTPDWGARVDVTGDLILYTNTAVYPWSHPRNGGSPLFRAQNVRIASGGRINADCIGFSRGLSTNGWGPGGGRYISTGNTAGGGHGGRGGRYSLSFGQSYGDSNAPVQAGSGGSGGGGTYLDLYVGQDGGGVARIEVAGTLDLGGTISANGGSASAYGGGGAGGSIYLRMKTFRGTNGTLSARGGAASTVNAAGGGGGGRIAVWRAIDAYDGPCVSLVTGGAGTGATGTGEVGTVTYGWLALPSPGVTVRVR